MTRSPFIKRWGRTCLRTLLLALATLSASAASPKRVLILDPFGRDVAPFSAALSAFRATLAREFGERLEFYEISLDRARFPEPKGQDPFLEFLENRITNRPMNLVATFGGPGMDFVLRHHERFFPNTPIIFMAGPPEVARTNSLRGKAAQVTHTLNLAGMVEDILQLQPQTTNIVVVFGASALETFTVNDCRREFQRFTNRVGFTWLNDLPLERVLERCAALPPHSFVLHVLFLVDAAGTPFEQNEPLRRLHAVANAPLFGYFASEFGLGAIGGRLFQDSEIGVQAARTAIRILHGESPGSIPVLELKSTTPVYDWRELRRWGIRDSDLPPGSVVQFYQRTFWELYRWWIAGVIGFCLCQAALIIALLVQRSKRRQGEAVLLQQREELAHVTRVSTVSQLTSSIAHELNQPLGAILRNAEAGELILQDSSPDLEEIRAILADIRADEQRAGEVIDRVRALLKRHAVERVPVSLEQLTGEVFTLLRPDAEMRRVQMTLTIASALPAAQGDRVRLQQVLLNLLLNAMDAVNVNPPPNRLVTVRVQHTDATVEIAVSDNGPGIPADQLPRLFTPFFTSKPNGLGMGLVISRTIIEEHGGRLSAHNEPAGGATFTIVLPADGAGPVGKT